MQLHDHNRVSNGLINVFAGCRDLYLKLSWYMSSSTVSQSHVARVVYYLNDMTRNWLNTNNCHLQLTQLWTHVKPFARLVELFKTPIYICTCLTRTDVTRWCQWLRDVWNTLFHYRNTVNLPYVSGMSRYASLRLS